MAISILEELLEEEYDEEILGEILASYMDLGYYDQLEDLYKTYKSDISKDENLGLVYEALVKNDSQDIAIVYQVDTSLFIDLIHGETGELFTSYEKTDYYGYKILRNNGKKIL